MPYVKLVTTKQGWGGVRGQIMEVSEIRAERWCNALRIAEPATDREEKRYQSAKKKFEAEKGKNGGNTAMEPVICRVNPALIEVTQPVPGGPDDPGGDDGDPKKKE